MNASTTHSEFTVHAPDGEMIVSLTHPAGEGRWPGVVMYMDAMGVREELYKLARNLAAQGYAVFLPDLYYRLGLYRPRLRTRHKAAAKAVHTQIFAAIESVSPATAVEDTGLLLPAMAASPVVAPGPYGAVGFCMSGAFVLAAAGSFPERFAAAASLFGTSMVTDAADSPHLLARAARGGLYFGMAENDDHVPLTVLPAIEDALKAAGVSYEMEVLPGTRHGFCFEDALGRTYNDAAAKRVWQKIFALYARHLKA